jgi:hypothetical protein
MLQIKQGYKPKIIQETNGANGKTPYFCFLLGAAFKDIVQPKKRGV